MNKIKYFLIHFEMLAYLFSIVLGIGAAESSQWGWSYLLLFGPFVIGEILDFNSHIHFLEIYDRAWNIKLKSSK